MHVNRACGKGNLDLRLPKPPENSFSQFVLDQILIREFPDMADERQVQR